MGRIAPFRESREDGLRAFLSERAGSLAIGFLAAAFLAFCVFGLAKLETLSHKIDALSKAVAAKQDSGELTRTRYEALLRETHEIKVLINYGTALYQDDVRRGLVPKPK